MEEALDICIKYAMSYSMLIQRTGEVCDTGRGF